MIFPYKKENLPKYHDYELNDNHPLLNFRESFFDTATFAPKYYEKITKEKMYNMMNFYYNDFDLYLTEILKYKTLLLLKVFYDRSMLEKPILVILNNKDFFAYSKWLKYKRSK